MIAQNLINILDSSFRVLAEIKERFKQYTESNKASAIPADLRLLILTYGVKFGGEKEYENALSIYRKSSDPLEKLAAMHALCATTDEKLISKTL